MTNFFRTISIIFQNPFVNPYLATVRHLGLAVRKTLDLFPSDVHFGDRIVRIPNRATADGSAALANAMGYYDPNNMFFIREIFEAGMYETFFDIGSNIGIYSLIVAGRAERARAYAFEPHPETFAILSRNVQLNEQEDGILCSRLALSDQNGRVLFRDNAGHPENRVLEAPDLHGDVIEVTAKRGDDFCKEYQIPVPHVIKIDVEGHENRVLAGFSSILASIRLIFIECWELERTNELLCTGANFLGPYKIDYKNRRFVRGNSNHEDWVFVNPGEVERLKDIMTFE